MLSFIKRKKKSIDNPPESSPLAEDEEKDEDKYKNNIDEIEKNSEELIEEEIMKEEKEEEIMPIKGNESENSNAIKEIIEEVSESEEVNPEEKFAEIAQTFAKERGIEDADLEAGMKALREIRDGWQSGELTTDMLALVMRGLEYDKAVKEAREAGEIAGRNNQIEEKYMRPIESDGLPHLAGSNVRKNSARVASIFDLARQSYQ